MKNQLKCIILISSISLLTACGGGGSDDSSSADEPITPFTSYGHSEDQGRKITKAVGTEGDVVATIDEYNDLNYSFINNLATINIDRIQKTSIITLNCPNYSTKTTFTENGNNGIINMSSTFNGHSVNCSFTYPTFYPTDVDLTSINNFIFGWFNDNAQENIVVSCTEGMSSNHRFNFETEHDIFMCEDIWLVNLSITDNDGKTHLISFEEASRPN